MLDCRYFLFLLFVTWMHFKRSLPEGLGDPITYLNLHLCGTLHETRCIWNLICCDRKVIYS